MNAYRGEQLATASRARLERAAALAERTVPVILARRAARRIAGCCGCVLAAAFLLVATPQGLGLDERLQPETCGAGPCETTWRVLGFVVVVLATLSIWAVVRGAALLLATRRLGARLALARAAGTLDAALGREVAAASAREGASTTWPLAAAVLLGPIGVHGLLVAGFGLSVFDRWIGTLEACVGPAQLAMVACSVWDARVWKGLLVRQLEGERSWRRSFALGVGATVVTSFVLLASEIHFADVAPALGLVAAGLSGLTFLAFWPLAHRLVKRWIITERSNLDDVQVALERMDDAVKVDELPLHVSV